MIRKVSLAMLFAMAVSTTALAQVKLERKYTPGASYKKQEYSKIAQSLNIAGMDTVSNVEVHSSAQVAVGQPDPEGKVRLEEKTTGLQVTMAVGGQEYRFDSANPDNKGSSQLEILRDLHKLMLKTPTTTVLGKDRRVAAVEFDSGLLNSLPAEAQEMAKSQLDPESLKKAANQTLEQVPSDPVKPGDTWTRTETSNFGAGQLMTFKVQYTYDGTMDKGGQQLHKITSKTMSVEFGLEANSPLPFKLKGSKLNASDSAGTILFDQALGRVVEKKTTAHIVGDITFDINGMELPAKLDLMMSSEETSPK